jgi:lincosamide nucleotidyltransferase A/C/D/E
MNKKTPEMTAGDVTNIVKLFHQNDIELVIDGGWGVDALLGEQTRPHADLDVAVLHKDVPKIRALLAASGWHQVPWGDTWECNFVLGDDHGHLFDIHSCTFDEAGKNIFGVKYPFDSWKGTGSIDGLQVRCISPEWMVKFHSGYKLDENDYHDVKLLCERFAIEIPKEYDEFVLNDNKTLEHPMDEITKKKLAELWSTDRQVQYHAFLAVLAITDKPVDWAYEVWDDLLARLSHKDNHVRAIAAQLLCNLAKSDPKNRMLKDFPALLAVTKDERFVTARHTMQALWKVGTAGREQKKLLVEGLEGRFRECVTEKNCTLIRYDILQSLRNVYDAAPDESIREKALELIEMETDLKFHRKYASLWKYK